QNNDVIGVEMNQGISTITIQNAQGLVLYGKKTSGPFAGKWFIEEGDKGSLQLRKISSSAVSIALINNTKQPLTIISTDVTLAQGQLYNQDIDDGYTPLLRAQNNDVIGVERHNNVSTITIEDAQGHVLYGKQISGGFAGKWSIEEGARGSLQLRQIPAFNSAWDVPGSWQLYCRTATLSNNVLTAKCQAFDPLYTGGWWKTTSINLEDRGSVGNADGLFRVASVKGQLVPER
ncbi:hypothetical protein M1466_02740, partial [Candidatus Dependentiae bacterium]|nr:hypothetical protein [Candidatus Dependentiae bacterium]